ncbi:MAG: glycogen/starch synthase, partial [Planctomycetes bacterium]|nr:glycogen/starch synthase [Planctomycetota bacterium]
MRVFMLGWEFPPHISGGLGTACYGMTKGLDEIGVSVCFVLPKAVPAAAPSHVQIRSPADLPGYVQAGPTETVVSREFEHVELRRVDAVLRAYASPEGFEEAVKRVVSEQQIIRQAGEAAPRRPGEQGDSAGQETGQAMPTGAFASGAGAHYAGDLMGQVQRYARLALELSAEEDFDVIHAHDWMTYPAGLAVAAASRKPLVVHVHSTEFDRSGETPNQQIYEIERMGMH